MNYLPYLFLSVSMLVGHNLLQKIISSKISPALAPLFLSIGIFLSGIIILLVQSVSKQKIHASPQGILLALFSGFLWGLGSLFTVYAYSKGAPLSQGLPLIVGGLVLSSTITGFLVLGESLSATKVIGTALLIISLFFISKS